MSDRWVMVGALALAAVLPFALLALVRGAARSFPALARWATAVERQHRRAFWVTIAVLYAATGVAHFASGTGEPLFGAAFLLLSGASVFKAAS